jgi:hypothetical protein
VQKEAEQKKDCNRAVHRFDDERNDAPKTRERGGWVWLRSVRGRERMGVVEGAYIRKGADG